MLVVVVVVEVVVAAVVVVVTVVVVVVVLVLALVVVVVAVYSVILWAASAHFAHVEPGLRQESRLFRILPNRRERRSLQHLPPLYYTVLY